MNSFIICSIIERGIGMKSQKISIGLVIFVTLILFLSTNVPSTALDDWNDGDEAKYTGGHTFDEEFWLADYTNETKEGYNLTSSIFYMNSHNVEAFLIAVKEIKNDTNIGTVPYQLFGMHYYSPEGHEVFIGAIFAFLLGYNDTNNPDQGVPDPGQEDLFYIIPFGAGDLVGNRYIPSVSHSVERKSDTEYIFEISYYNLYAIITQNPFWGALLKTGWVARFTELTIRYKITIDEENGEVRAETFYNLGQVTELWAVILGLPIPVSPDKIPANFGIAAVHYVATFTSYSRIVGAATNTTIQTGITEPVNEDLTIETEKERVFKIGFRGTYDIIDETNDPPETIKADEKAINILLKARVEDTWLVMNQLAFSADLMSVMAYGLSDNLQDEFDSPRDLKEKAILKFHTNTLWYAVAFPEWAGYRIEHDPVYTAYTSFGVPKPVDGDSDSSSPCGNYILILMATTASVCVIGIRKKRR
jgi:hypothetical protein